MTIQELDRLLQKRIDGYTAELAEVGRAEGNNNFYFSTRGKRAEAASIILLIRATLPDEQGADHAQ